MPIDIRRVVRDPLLFLEGRDLRVVDHVEHGDAVSDDLDLTKAIDGEVAERMREGRHRHQDRQPDRA